MLIAVQVVVFNHIALLGYAVGFIFIYTLLHLPLTLSANWTLTIDSSGSRSVDIFADTQGMNAIACTILDPPQPLRWCRWALLRGIR